MSKLKAIIVDDENHCRITLAKLLDWHCPGIEVIASCSGPDEAKIAIESMDLDLLFLDIEMPVKNGFDLLNDLDDINFDVIFTTAFDQFAIDAFKVHATAYLLKPIDKDELISSINKLTSRRQKLNLDQDQLSAIFKSLSSQNANKKRVAIPTSEGIEYIDPNLIIRCEAEGNYTRIYIQGKKELFISKNLKQVEELIGNPNFIRPHKSHLVNKKYIKKYIKGTGGQLILDDEKMIPVSRYRKEELDLQ